MLTPEHIDRVKIQLEEEQVRIREEYVAPGSGPARKEMLELRSRRVAAALMRIRRGKFGLCCHCGEPLTVELDSDLTPPFCQYCQKDLELQRN